MNLMPCALPGTWTPFTVNAGADKALFSAAFNRGGEDRARFEGGKRSPSASPSSSVKMSKTQSLPRPSARPDLPRLWLRLPEGLGMRSPCTDGLSCLFSSNVAILRRMNWYGELTGTVGKEILDIAWSRMEQLANCVLLNSRTDNCSSRCLHVDLLLHS
jgi:hypothetical protein